MWLNAIGPVDAVVAASNREGLGAAGVPLWTRLEDLDLTGEASPATGTDRQNSSWSWIERCRSELAERDRKKLRRQLWVTEAEPGELNLADNDYLDLARDPAVVAAAAQAASRYGTSAAASPLVTGWREPHARLVETLGAWHGFSSGLLWSSGYAANSAVLGTLPRRGDLVLADRLVHHSIVAGMLRSGARVQRYRTPESGRAGAAARRGEGGRSGAEPLSW